MNQEPVISPISLPEALQVIAKQGQQIDYLEEMVRLLKNEIFGRKSEKSQPADQFQISLFEEEANEPVDVTKKIIVPEHTRDKKGRKPLSKDLPRIEVVHDIAEEDKVCACGSELTVIGQDTSEKLDYIPAKLRVIRHIRPKYACRSCEGVEDDGPTVKIAPPPLQLIPKSYASEGLLAHLVVAKFVDALPLYRQEKIFKRLNIDLSRSTMSGWLVQVAQKCQPLIDLLAKEVRSGPLINADETPVQVLKEPGRKNTTKSYMWVFRGGQMDSPALIYHYHPTRNGDVALSFLKGYKGYVQSDAFSGYEKLSKEKEIKRVGCWAHARRAFVKVVSAKKKNRSAGNPKGLADEALDYIGALYKLEKDARINELSFDEIYQMRQSESRPLLESFKTWLDAKKGLTPPKGLLGKAIHYSLDNWGKLITYLEDGRLKPDNNAAENAIRPFVIGRKNWLFAGHPNGAMAAATFFSLIETAKANGLEPYAYFRCLFEEIITANSEEDYRRLLPQYIDRGLMNAQK
ncbi:IS66 family transposase [Desulfobacterales bacterium HSG17]|nr:IS66 family transposase [Desulfobacterales bacterium HSG17]